MGSLDKYKISTQPPKISRRVAKASPIDAIRATFLAGLKKQKAQAAAWKPGAKDLRSWVTRDEARGLAWVTVKYGARPVPVKGATKSTIGPIKLADLPRVFDDVEKAAQAGELDKGLLKAATLGPRKTRRGKAK